ncbi:MAG: helix-turn-helix transcriptional regulator [Clostridia bacterium]|nr:helix-turn-helix transcriptional regulator [Clostridia bacterium]
MKTVPLSSLCYTDFDVCITDVFPENWMQRREFSLYKNRPRPASALFFVCSDRAVTFFPSDESPTLTARRGDIVFIPQGYRYYAQIDGENRKSIDTYTLNLHFLDEERADVLLSPHITVLAHRQDNHHELSLQRICDAFHRASPQAADKKRNLARAKGELLLLLDLIGAGTLQNDDFYYPIRRGVEAFCEEWNQNEKIEKYAQMSDVSVTYFYRCFRKWSGKSPVEYRNALRLSNAESLLRCTDMKIGEIARAVGYDDPFYFCRIFSDTHGTSPQRYRKQCGDADGE